VAEVFGGAEPAAGAGQVFAEEGARLGAPYGAVVTHPCGVRKDGGTQGFAGSSGLQVPVRLALRLALRAGSRLENGYVTSGGSALLIAALTFSIKSSRVPNSDGSIGG